MHHTTKLKDKYEKEYEVYKREFEANPPDGATLKDAFQWGNTQATRDIENKTPEVEEEVDNYIWRYNTGVVKNAEEYHAIINNDTELLEKRRVEKMKKVQK